MAETTVNQDDNGDDEFEKIMRQNGFRIDGRRRHLSEGQFGYLYKNKSAMDGAAFRFKDASNVFDLNTRVNFDGEKVSDEANAVWDIFNMDKEVDKMKKELKDEPEDGAEDGSVE